jgi:RNA polymerase sigma factor (sigma-70 family)
LVFRNRGIILGWYIQSYPLKITAVTDQEIYEGIARRDNRTFLYLYEQYQGRILHMVQQNNGNSADATDIFQEGLIALWTNIKQGKFELTNNAKISTYLYALCRNLWISRLRKKKIIQPVDNNPKLEAIADEVDDMETQNEQITTLRNHFSRLSEGCRKILQLFYYQKVSLKEIAGQLNITEKTAKNNKYRCMQNLRSNYQSENSAS